MAEIIPYRITRQCTSCDACRLVCPENAVFVALEGYGIDAQRCNGCGMCAALCPEGAVVRAAAAALGRRG